MKLYANYPSNLLVQVTMVAAQVAGQTVEVVYLTPEQIKEPEFQKKKGSYGFPMLELDSGEIIAESTAICSYFGRLGAAGGVTPFEQAKCDEWVAFTQTSIMKGIRPVYMGVFGNVEIPSATFAKDINFLKAQAKILNTYLKDRSFLVGDKMTIADAVVAGFLVIAFQTVFDGGFRKGMSNLTAWFTKCIGTDAFVNNMGHIKMTDKAMKAFDSKAVAKAAPAPKKAAKKEEDDLDDLFGDDDNDDGAAEAVKKAAEAAKDKKKAKKVVIAQSLVLFEIKPLDSETDLDVLSGKILELTGDGIYWKTEYKKEPVAYGIFKLIMGVTVEDEKVSVDGLQERIEALDDMVQSVEIAAFNKI